MMGDVDRVIQRQFGEYEMVLTWDNLMGDVDRVKQRQFGEYEMVLTWDNLQRRGWIGPCLCVIWTRQMAEYPSLN